MNCRDTQSLIDGYVDGEVDLVRSIEIERHLEDCGACLEALSSRRAVREAVRSEALRFEAPRGLESRVLAAARAEVRSGATSPAGWRRLTVLPSLAFGAAACLFAALLVWSVTHPVVTSRGEAMAAEDLVSGHVRSLLANHLYDVASTDQHTVKPWFNGKLDYSPTVVDLKGDGYPLAGGRLDYLNGRPVAALVYTHRRHVINLFIWPDAAAASEPRFRTESLRGYHLVHWSSGRMAFHAISDLNAADLATFAKDVAQVAP